MFQKMYEFWISGKLAAAIFAICMVLIIESILKQVFGL